MKKKEGFTLLELLLVIALIGVVSIFSVSNLLNNQKKARDNRRKTDLNLIASALEKYYAVNKEYPCVADKGALKGAISTTLPDPWIPGLTNEFTHYSGFLPKDPINSGSFIYLYFSTNNTCAGSPPPRQTSYWIFAQLENTRDPQLKNNPTAKCYYLGEPLNYMGPDGWNFNYCVRQPL